MSRTGVCAVTALAFIIGLMLGYVVNQPASARIFVRTWCEATGEVWCATFAHDPSTGNNIRHGLSAVWLHGRVKKELSFFRGIQDGAQREFGPDGEVISELFSYHGSAFETVIQYHPSGTVAAHGAKYSGKADGAWCYYWPKGTLKSVMNYHEGTLNGTRIDWHENGELWKVGSYANGGL